ncbi:uncharacterized protein DUF2663 [Scopulibacillus darangshiensis]|uniref:Uncharacterized protein DUF2663 n=1 Tax=Scopulibacillus darangshiensis TaxID=442528 RepID=A0A4V2SNM2_9BACL|nr:DUF2663 family protein [Scopulibacillus darangshiensis]TCP31676.1 uncharacterized protein DUF2663 [Scopulibacillus darangshiensis]
MQELKNLRDEGMVPELTYDILLKLIKRKDKEAKYKKIRTFWGFSLIIIYTILLYYLFYFKLSGSSQLHQLSSILADPFVLLLAIVAIGLTVIWVTIQKKYDDADDDYNDLRKEVIDRHFELWYKQLDGRGKREVLALLDKKKDINLYHK